MLQWDSLPEYMKNDSVLSYYTILRKKKLHLFLKRFVDIVFSFILIILLFPLMLIISLAIVFDSKGPVFFRQVRVTTAGKQFRIFKFRTMVNNAEKLGTSVTIHNDNRITKVGMLLRKLRIDEVPQLFNVLVGDMSFVGTRPEVVRYVESYTSEMYATLLMKAGITSSASIAFKDEDTILSGAVDVDDVYISTVLPKKMVYNLDYIKNYAVWLDFAIMFKTVFAVLKR